MRSNKGQFDEVDAETPPSHPNMKHVEWDPVAQAFPYREEAHTVRNNTVSLNPQDYQATQRGPIFQGLQDRDADYVPNGYYIDKRASGLSMSFADGDQHPQKADGRRAPWYHMFTPRDSDQLSPVQLIFFPEADLGHRNWINTSLGDEELVKGRWSLSVEQVGIHLLPGEELTLHLSCAFEAGRGGRNATIL